jgi:hypothetical protein
MSIKESSIAKLQGQSNYGVWWLRISAILESKDLFDAVNHNNGVDIASVELDVWIESTRSRCWWLKRTMSSAELSNARASERYQHKEYEMYSAYTSNWVCQAEYSIERVQWNERVRRQDVAHGFC